MAEQAGIQKHPKSSLGIPTGDHHPLPRRQKCEKKEELIKDLRDEIEEHQLESSQAFMTLG